jgi:hypothetical protein
MNNNMPNITAKQPEGVFDKSFQLDFKGLFTSLARGDSRCPLRWIGSEVIFRAVKG